MDAIYPVLCLLVVVIQTASGFVDLSETEQVQMAEEKAELEEIVTAKEMVDKMKAGIGGSTIAIHTPSGRQFIHRHRWILICHGKISYENGHCSGDSLQSLNSFEPATDQDFCYIKNRPSINGTLCLSPQPVTFYMENNTLICKPTSKYFPVLMVAIEDYIKTCKVITNRVTYVYFSNSKDPNHVELPSKNQRVRCDDQRTVEKYKYNFAARHLVAKAAKLSEVCVFTEEDLLPVEGLSQP